MNDVVLKTTYRWVMIFLMLLLVAALLPTSRVYAQSVLPLITCVQQTSPNTIHIEWGYESSYAGDVAIPFGVDNFFFPSPNFRGQPLTFHAGLHNFVLGTDLVGSGSITWHLNGVLVTFNSTLLGSFPPCAATTVTTIVTSPTVTVTATTTVFSTGAATTVFSTVTVMVTVQGVREYPLGLPLLAIFMIIAYGLIKRRTRNPKNI